MEADDCRDTVDAGDVVASEPASVTAGDPFVGARIDRYVVGMPIGRGGMGVVHVAHDLELHRDVALKILGGRRRDEATEAARMLREAQALARFSHPNVVKVFGCGRWRDRVYIAMELVRGETLRAWHARTHPRWREIVAVITDAGHALAEAHTQGIVHRDVKPDNVLVRDDHRVLLVDFGIAMVEGDGPSHGPAGSGERDGAPLTEAGTVVGTPGYLAPELLAGSRATPASDQFALCVSLFELLYGERPYAPGPHLRADMMAHRVRQVGGRRSVPSRLRRVLLRGLSPDPLHRWPTIDALLRELRRAGPRWPWIGAGVAASAMVAVALVDRDGPCDGSGALDGVWSAERRETLAHALEDGVGPAGAVMVPPLLERVDLRTAAWAETRRAVCAGRVDDDAGLDARMSCLRRTLGEIDATIAVLAELDARNVHRAGQLVDRLPDAQDCLDAAQPGSSARDHPQLDAVRAKLARAAALGEVGRHDDELALALDLVATTAEPPASALRPEALLRLAQASWSAGDLTRAESSFDGALLEAEAHGADRVSARAAVDMVSFLAKADRVAEAEAMASRARAAIARLGGDRTLLAYLEGNVGSMLVASGRGEEALPHYEESLRLREEMFGRDDVDTLTAANGLGIALARLGRIDEARPLLERAAAGLEAARGRDHPDTGATLTNLANLIERSDPQAALAIRERALAIFTASFAGPHPWVAIGHHSLGLTLGKLGRDAEALSHLETALHMRATRLGERHPETIAAMSTTSHAMGRLGRHRDALVLQHRHLDALEQVWGPAAVELAPAHLGIAEVLHALGRDDDALVQIDRARAVLEGHPDHAAQADLDALARTIAGAPDSPAAAEHLSR